MSHLNVKGGPVADKRNVLGVFSKHLKSQLKTPVPANNANSCCKYCSHADKSKTVHSNVMPVKEKRLKSRKERDQIRNGCHGQKVKSHSRPKQSSRREHRESESCQPSIHSHNREQFAKAFAHKEPSFITERRLLGHQGLFNHEVKSFDIERLLSEEGKAEKSQKQLNNTSQKAFSPMLSPTQNSDDDKKCSPNHKHEMSRKSSRQGASAETGCGDAVRSQTGLKSDDKGESFTNNHRSGAFPCRRKTERTDHSPSESNSVVVLSSTPKSSVSHKIPQSTPKISVDGYNSPKMHCAGSPSQAAPYNTSAQHSEYTPTGLKSPVPHPKAQLTVNKGTPDLSVAKDMSSSSQDQKAESKTERSWLEAKVAKHLISVVAGRLCQSLDRPLLLRHHLLADSRATLLHVLQERHGTLLQQNLFKLHTRLGLEQSQVGTGCSTGMHSNALEDKWTAALIDAKSSSLGPGPVQQSWLRSKEKPVSKRRRKQTCPQRRTPPSPPPSQGPFSEPLHSTGLRKSQAWTLKMGTEQEVLMEPSDRTFRPDPFPFCDQTSNIFLMGGNTFSSRWGPHTGLSQSWNRRLGQKKSCPQTMRDPYEKWRHDPDLNFLCPTEYQGQHKHPFSSYKAMPADSTLREPEHLTVHQQLDCKRQHVSACSPDTAHTSLKNLQLQPYYRFHHPLTSASSSLTSYRPDMSFYPPSELLDTALSPPKHPSASPDGWSYPRMRLY